MPPDTEDKEKQKISLQMARKVYLKIALYSVFEGVLTGFGILMVGLALAVITTSRIEIVMFLSGMGMVIVVLNKWRHLVSSRSFARYLFRILPETEDYLSLVELQNQGDTPFIERLRESAQKSLKNAEKKIGIANIYKRFAVYSIPLFLLVIAITPGRVVQTIYINYGYPDPFGPGVFVLPGDMQILEGETAKFHVETFNISDKPTIVIDEMDTVRLKPVRRNVFEGSVVFTYPGRREYHIVADGFTSRNYRIDVTPTPIVENLVALLRFPEYTGWKADTLDSPYDISVPAGTRVELAGKVLYADSFLVSNVSEGILYRGSVSDFRLKKTVNNPVDLDFTFFKGNREIQEKGYISIKTFPDDPPKIKILVPYLSVIDLPNDEIVPVVSYIEDDYGIKRVEAIINFHGGESRIPLKRYKGFVKQDTVATSLDLNPFNMMPGEELSFIIRAMDTGGQWSKSDRIVVRFPTLEETYEEVAEATQKGAKSVFDIKRKTEQLLQEIQKVTQDIQSEKKFDWGKQQETSKLLKKQTEILKKVEKTLKTLKEATRSLQSFASIDPELAEMAQRVSELFQEVMTEDLRKSLEKLQQAVSRMRPEEIQRALQDLQKNQEQLKNALERMESILKRFKQELELAQLEEKISKLMEEQSRLLNETQEAKTPGEFDKLREKQEKLREELQKALGEMKSLSEELQEEAKPISDSLSSITNTEGAQADSVMNQASSFLSSGDMPQAAMNQRFALQKLSEMRQKLSELRKSFQNFRKQEIVKKLRKIIRELTFLSGAASDVLGRLKSGEDDPAVLVHRLEGVQEGIGKAVNGLQELSKQTLMLSMALSGILEKSADKMHSVAMSLGSRRLNRATGDLKQSLAMLNRAILVLFRVESRMSQSQGSSTGLEQMMQSLANLASQQMQLNMQGQSMLPIPSPVPEAIREQLARMAAQQEALRKALEELQQQLGDEGLYSALEGAKKAMEEAEQALKKGTYNEEILKKQEKALERLLQAERSVRKRGFARKRKSTPGKPYELSNPPEPVEPAFWREKIKRTLLRLDDLDIDPSYKNLIEAYLKTLLKRGTPIRNP